MRRGLVGGNHNRIAPRKHRGRAVQRIVEGGRHVADMAQFAGADRR
jgi:hypothetical protein